MLAIPSDDRLLTENIISEILMVGLYNTSNCAELFSFVIFIIANC